MNHHRLLPYLSGLFVGTLLIARTIDTKLFDLGPFTLSGGTLIIPLAYLFTNILTEVYGYSITRKIIWTGVLAQLLMVAAYQLAAWIPPASCLKHPEIYPLLFNQVPRMVFAGIIAYFCGDFLNSFLLARMKIKTNGRHIAWRFIFSTLIGQGAHSALFISLAFMETYPTVILLKMILCVWVLKVLWEIIALPITLLIVAAIKKHEHEDYFDRHTDFNPLKFE